MATRPLLTSIAISHKLMLLSASGPASPSRARRARDERRRGSRTSCSRTCVSKTTKLGVPDLARRAHDVADARLAPERLQPLARGRLKVLFRHDARDDFAMHHHLDRFARAHA